MDGLAPEAGLWYVLSTCLASKTMLKSLPSLGRPPFATTVRPIAQIWPLARVITPR
jgi:hypothetical protein